MRTTMKKGFTLIELLIVVVIIGIHAAIAIPKFANTKEKAYIASMKSDLRNLVTAQEAYFADHANMYAPDYNSISGNYKPSTGVTVSLTGTAGTAWTATATHVALASGKSCQIAIGGGATNEGEPVCN